MTGGGSGLGGAAATGGSTGTGGVIATGGNTVTGGAGGVMAGTGGAIPGPSAVDTTPHAVCDFRALSGALSGAWSYDVGHKDNVMQVAIAGERILSRDSTGHWNLWNATTRQVVARGDLACLPSDQGCVYRSVELAGDLLVVETSAGDFELRSAGDGRLVTTVAVPGGHPHLEQSGRYLWTATATGLRAWAATGQPLLTISGDYSSAKVFAAATELRAVSGPAGATVVERIQTATGSRSSSLPFSGTFGFWFRDGERFLTWVSNTYTIYAKDGTLQQSHILPARPIDSGDSGGYGDYFWIGGGPVYKVAGNSMPVTLVDGGGASKEVPGAFIVGDFLLTPSGENLAQYAFPNFTPYSGPRTTSAVAPDGHWVLGGDLGNVTDSRSPTPGRSLSCPVRTAHGNPAGDLAVVLYHARDLLLFHLGPNGPGSPTRYPWGLERAHLTDDGKRVAISGVGGLMSAGMSRGPGVEVRSLPGGEVIATWGAPLSTGIQNARISGDGELVVMQRFVGFGAMRTPDTIAVATVGAAVGPFLYTGPYFVPVALAPRGHLFTISPNVTEVRRDMTVLSNIDGAVTTWLDELRILSAYNLFGMPPGAPRIYGTQGTVLSMPPLPQMREATPVGGDRVMEPSGALYNIASGQKVWSTTFTVDGPFAREDLGPGFTTVAGPYAVYGHGAELIIEKY